MRQLNTKPRRPATRWMRFWMRMAGSGRWGRFATRMATLTAPPHFERVRLASMHRYGYIAPDADLYHADLHLGEHIFIGERVILLQRRCGGRTVLGDRVCVYRDSVLETDRGASLTIGADSSIHSRCQINAYVEPIAIGRDVMVAADCALFSYDHGIAPGRSISEQPLTSRGPIEIGDGAWIGTGAVILSGVRVGEGAVIGAGAVVNRDVPDYTVAVGNPARVVRRRCGAAVAPAPPFEPTGRRAVPGG